MSRLRVTPKGKVAKSNIPITRIGKKQYLKRRFLHIRKVDIAGKDNKLTQEYHVGKHTAAQNYTRLGLSINPSATPREVEMQKKVVKPGMKRHFKEPEPEKNTNLGQPVSEQEGSMLGNLMSKYGTDLKRMSLDYHLNPFQLTPRQLQRRIVNYLRFERAAFPEQYATAEANGWLDDYTDNNLRRRRVEE